VGVGVGDGAGVGDGLGVDGEEEEAALESPVSPIGAPPPPTPDDVYLGALTLRVELWEI